MGFEEIFAFLVVGGVAIYHQRSLMIARNLSGNSSVKPKNLASDRLRPILLWTLAVAIPSIAIAVNVIYKINLPLTFVTIGFLIFLWIYSNWQNFTQVNEQADGQIYGQINGQLSNQQSCILNPSEEQQLKDCFPQNVYQLKSLEYHPHEIYCRGRLRSQNYKYAYETISYNVHKIFGDRFVCALQESAIENLGTGFGKTTSLQNDQPHTANYSFYLIPNELAASHQSNHWLWIASLVCTAFTVITTGANIQSLEDFSLSRLNQGIPYFLGIASIFLARTIAQKYVARKYSAKHDFQDSKIATLNRPIFLPCFGGFGLLGSLSPNLNFLARHNPTSSQNFPNQRKIIFDLVSLPAIAGLMISLILIILGNWVLVPATTSAIADPQTTYTSLIPNLQNFDFKISILFALVHHTLQTIANLDKSVTNANEIIHRFSPLTLAGWSGLALSALQLLPFSFLGGGYLAIAMFGYRQTIQMSRIARIAILAIAILAQPWLRIYSLLLFLLPIPQPLILNETVDLDQKRDLLGIALMAIALLIILPLPKSLL